MMVSGDRYTQRDWAERITERAQHMQKGLSGDARQSVGNGEWAYLFKFASNG